MARAFLAICRCLEVSRNAPLKILTSSTDSGELRKICPIFPNPGSGGGDGSTRGIKAKQSDLPSPSTIASAKAADITTEVVVIPCKVSVESPDEDEQSSRGNYQEPNQEGYVFWDS